MPNVLSAARKRPPKSWTHTKAGRIVRLSLANEKMLRYRKIRILKIKIQVKIPIEDTKMRKYQS